MVWRLTQTRDQRSSPLSILIIMLAVSDFFYCVHLLLLESLVTESHLGQQKLWAQISTSYVCSTSALLSLFSCSTAQWATFNIALYSFQAMSGWCSRCCCSLVRKRILIITIICQIIFVIAGILSMLAVHQYFDDPFLFVPHEYEDVINYENNTWIQNYRYSRREQITEIFGRCAIVQSSGLDACINMTETISHGSHTTVIRSIICSERAHTEYYDYWGAAVACLSTVLTLSSVVLYLFLCVTIRRRSSRANVTSTSDIHKLQWRLSVIVILNTLCWIPTTALHLMSGIIQVSPGGPSDSWSSDSTAANVFLISMSPAVNPLIYTFAGKNFLHSIRKSCRQMKCDISVRRNDSNYHGDHIRGVERCSCIPWVRCVHQGEDNHPDYYNTEDTSDWNSDQSRLLPSTDESSEIT